MRVIPDQPTAMRAAIAGIAFSTADRQAVFPLGHEGAGGSGDLLAARRRVPWRPSPAPEALLEDEASARSATI